MLPTQIGCVMASVFLSSNQGQRVKQRSTNTALLMFARFALLFFFAAC